MTPIGRLRDRLHAVYGFAHFGKSMLWNLSALYFAFYLTEVAGIPTRAMGWVMAVSLLFNAVCDLMTGRWLSRFVHDTTAAARLQFKGAGLAAAAFVVFALTGFVPEGLRIGFSFVSLLLFRFGYSLMDVPQNSFMAFVTRTDRERAALASTRYIAAGLSVLLITVIVTPLVQLPDRDGQAGMFFLLAAVVSPMALLGGWLLHAVFRDAGPATGAAPATPPVDAPVPPSGRGIFPLLLACILLFSSLASLFSKLESYLTAYVLDDPVSAALFMPVIAIGQVAGQFVWPRLAHRFGLPAMLMMACAGWLAASGLLWLAIGHVAPAIIPAAFAYAAMAGGVLMAIWSLLALSCAATPRQTAWRYGVFTFCSKIAQAAAVVTIGEWLSRFDYRSPGGADDRLVVLGMAGPVAAAVTIGCLAYLLRRRSLADLHIKKSLYRH